jgi:hypothetical protein
VTTAERALFEATLARLGLADLAAVEVERLWRSRLAQIEAIAALDARLAPQDEAELVLVARRRGGA